MDNQKTTTSKKRKGGLIIACLCVIIILLAVIIVLLVRGRNSDTNLSSGAGIAAETPEPTLRSTVISTDNAEDVAQAMTNVEFVEPGYYTVTMSTEWHFAKGDTVSEDAYVENLPENTNDVYFDVVLAEDENQVILASPVIPRGQYWDEISLDTPLEKGTHDCVMIYHLIDGEQNTVSTLRVGLTIVVDS